MTDHNKATDERNVDRHDAAGMAGWLRERAKANREVAKLPREQWPHRPDVLLHWALRFDQGAVLVERLELERLQAVHERDCAVESLAAADRLLRKYLDREFNPFEPNNQSATYKELSAFLYPTSPPDVPELTWTCDQCDMRGRPVHATTCANCGAARSAPTRRGEPRG